MDFNISTALWFGARGEGRVLDPAYLADSQWPSIREGVIKDESVESAVENRTSKRIPAAITTGSPICTTCNRYKFKPGCVANACKFCCKKLSVTCSVHGLRSGVIPSPSRPVSIESFLTPYMSTKRVKSDCRILLVGHGADELFGGYGRHETRARVGGIDGLRSEMLLDLARLWHRNLGRDDRVLADNARDTRHLFLDEQVIEWVGRLHPSCMLSVNGENKPLLRQMAREMLGMEVASNFRKRAIQFGTRLAQQANLKCFGSHSQGKGEAIYIPQLD
jgi:hypothetical protein